MPKKLEKSNFFAIGPVVFVPNPSTQTCATELKE
jgi:hypothetical protein